MIEVNMLEEKVEGLYPPLFLWATAFRANRGRRDSSFTACLNRVYERSWTKGRRGMSEKIRSVDWETDRVAAHFEVDPAVGLDPREAERRLKTVGPQPATRSKGRRHLPLSYF